MVSTSLHGLRTEITLNGQSVNRAPRCIITYDRETVLSRAALHVPDADGSVLRSMGRGQQLVVHMGYRGQAVHSWTGTVDGWFQCKGNKCDQLAILAAGPELPLLTTTIREMWVDESAPAIARRILHASGLQLGVVDVPFAIIPRMTLATVPVWQAVRQLVHTLQTGHGHDMSAYGLWVDGGGRVNLGPQDHEAETLPVIKSQAGLIRHTPAQTVKGRSEVETFLLPTMRAGMPFRLEDARRGIAGTFRALRVEHSISPNKARTMLSFECV